MDQGLNPCLLHWQADSLPLSRQGSPVSFDLILLISPSPNSPLDCPGGSDGKASAYNAGDPGSIPGSGISPGELNGNPLQYSCLENSTDREAWKATVHGVAKSRMQLSDFTFTFHSPLAMFVFHVHETFYFVYRFTLLFLRFHM